MPLDQNQRDVTDRDREAASHARPGFVQVRGAREHNLKAARDAPCR